MMDETETVATTGNEGPRLYGVIDVMKSERVAGWVIDRADAEAFAVVDLVRDGLVVATQPACRPRKDLEKNGVGTGRYGFSIPLEPALRPGEEEMLSIVARSKDGVECVLKPTARLAGSRIVSEIKASDPLLTELGLLRAEISDERKRLEDSLLAQARCMEKLEAVQARLEAAMVKIEPADRKPESSTFGLALFGVGLGAISFVVGLWSLFM